MLLMPLLSKAQDDYPSVSPVAVYNDEDGNQVETSSDVSGQAPLTVSFRANPENMEGWAPTYEWHFRREGQSQEMMVRYEENTEYTFTEAGTTHVVLMVNLGGGEELDSVTIDVTVSESKLVFPNAFSPNGDGINDIFKAKEYQSLIEFHAYIYNRWGQKLFDWTDPSQGWDGTFNGKDVKEGVYYVLVKAKGADGIKYNIRRDVNLLRKYIEGNTINN